MWQCLAEPSHKLLKSPLAQLFRSQSANQWCDCGPVSSARHQYGRGWTDPQWKNKSFFNFPVKYHSEKWFKSKANKEQMNQSSIICMVYVDVMLAWNQSSHCSFGTIFLFGDKTSVIYHAERHYAQYPLITVIDMCLLACTLDPETTVVVLSVGCDLGRFLCCWCCEDKKERSFLRHLHI